MNYDSKMEKESKINRYSVNTRDITLIWAKRNTEIKAATVHPFSLEDEEPPAVKPRGRRVHTRAAKTTRQAKR